MFRCWTPAVLAVLLLNLGCGPAPAPDAVKNAKVISAPAPSARTEALSAKEAAPHDPTNGTGSPGAIVPRQDPAADVAAERAARKAEREAEIERKQEAARAALAAGLTPQAQATPVDARQYTQALVFDATQRDFGKLKSTAGIQTATFTATNRSDRRVKIVDTNKSCGCLLNKLSTMELLPGQALEVILQMNPAGRSGRTHHTLSIKSDEPTPIYTLSLGADVEYVPGSQAQYVYVNSLVRGTTQRVSTVVESASDKLSEATFQLTHPNLVFSDPEIDGATLSFDLSTISTAARGKLRADLLVRHTGTDELLATIPLLVVIDDNVAFNTPSLFLGRMIPGQEVRKEVQVVVHNGPLPPIRGVRLEQSTREQATAELIPGSQPPTIVVRVHPDAIPTQVFRDTLRVELQGEGQTEAVLPVVGLVARAGGQ